MSAFVQQFNFEESYQATDKIMCLLGKDLHSIDSVELFITHVSIRIALLCVVSLMTKRDCVSIWMLSSLDGQRGGCIR